MFQSRTGFLPRRDPWVVWCGVPAGEVSIPYWVSPSSRRLGVQVRRERFVSIPYWVSPSSRRSSMAARSEQLTRFNPVLGFSLVATIPKWRTPDPHVLFQSRTGFLPRRDYHDVFGRYGASLFQSRTGFLPRRDDMLGPGQAYWQLVSIPYWVSPSSRRHARARAGVLAARFNPVLGFSLVATTCSGPGRRTGSSFQSRTGFLPRRDTRGRSNGARALTFQSRTGFLPRRDPTCSSPPDFPHPVSIPYWVSPSSRRVRRR